MADWSGHKPKYRTSDVLEMMTVLDGNLTKASSVLTSLAVPPAVVEKVQLGSKWRVDGSNQLIAADRVMNGRDPRGQSGTWCYFWVWSPIFLTEHGPFTDHLSSKTPRGDLCLVCLFLTLTQVGPHGHTSDSWWYKDGFCLNIGDWSSFTSLDGRVRAHVVWLHSAEQNLIQNESCNDK